MIQPDVVPATRTCPDPEKIGAKQVRNVVRNVLTFSPEFQKKGLCSGWVINAGEGCVFSCTYCYVPSQLRKLLRRPQDEKKSFLKAGENHQDYVIRREGAVERLRQNLAKLPEAKRRSKQTVFMSSLVDPAPCKVLCNETVAVIRLVLEMTDWEVRILTKSAALKTIAEQFEDDRFKNRIVYGLSIGTLDDDIAKVIERGASPPSQRIKCLHWLQDHGFRTFGMICPSLPQSNYTTFSKQMCKTIRAAKCEEVFAEVLNVRGENKEQTIKALEVASKNAKLRAKYQETASRLNEVFSNGESWEKYARETFKAHAIHVPKRKLRFLQYSRKAGDAKWWAAHVKHGAILLGVTTTQQPAKTGKGEAKKAAAKRPRNWQKAAAELRIVKGKYSRRPNRSATNNARVSTGRKDAKRR